MHRSQNLPRLFTINARLKYCACQTAAPASHRDINKYRQIGVTEALVLGHIPAWLSNSFSLARSSEHLLEIYAISLLLKFIFIVEHFCRSTSENGFKPKRKTYHDARSAQCVSFPFLQPRICYTCVVEQSVCDQCVCV
jgi:hypothetical protein